MSTAISATAPNITRTERHSDHVFFPSMSLLILTAVLLGFGRSYYLAGVFRAPLPNLLVHIHGAAFSLWILLFIVQTTLVLGGRVTVHRRLGLVGFGLAALMVVIGLWAATDSMNRHFAPGQTGINIRAFYAVPVAAMVSFATLTFFGFRRRNNPMAHKRLMLVATVALLDAAVGRWPIAASWWDLRTAQLCCYLLLLLLMCYDLWLLRRIHGATLLGSTVVILLQQAAGFLGHSALWQGFAASAQSYFGLQN